MISVVRVYVEGGGADGKTKRPLRLGLDGFFRDLKERARAKRIHLEFVPCGGRASAYEDFCIALRSRPEFFNVLLVDAESPVTATPWLHLKNRREDRWDNPGVGDDQCHLMVQAMEAWLIADAERLAEYYGQGFQHSAIPRAPNVEHVDKTTLERSLENATRRTLKGRYHKTRHAPQILQRIRAAVVRAKAPSCDRLLKTLANWIESAGRERES